MMKQADQMKSFIKHFDGPVLQMVTKIIKSEEIRKTATEVFDKGKWKLFGLLQLTGMIFIIVFRAWRSTKAETFLAKLWVSFYSSFIYVGVSFYVIPMVVFGQGYRTLIVEIYKVATA